MKALDEQEYAVDFEPSTGTVTLISDIGPDRKWNTRDDTVVRVLRLKDKGGGLRFGYGSYGPRDGLRAAPDGIAFTNNRLICNDRLTGLSGSVYLISAYGGAAEITVSNNTFPYPLYRWNGAKWTKY